MGLDLLTPIRARLIGFSRALCVGSECCLSGVYHAPVGLAARCRDPHLYAVTGCVPGPDWGGGGRAGRRSTGAATRVHRGVRGGFRFPGAMGAGRQEQLYAASADSPSRRSTTATLQSVALGRALWSQCSGLRHAAVSRPGGPEFASRGSQWVCHAVCVWRGDVRPLDRPGRLEGLAAGPGTAQRPTPLSAVPDRRGTALDWVLRYRQWLALEYSLDYRVNVAQEEGAYDASVDNRKSGESGWGSH